MEIVKNAKLPKAENRTRLWENSSWWQKHTLAWKNPF